MSDLGTTDAIEDGSTPRLFDECDDKLERVIVALERLDDSPVNQMQRAANEFATLLNEVQYAMRIIRERAKTRYVGRD